MKYSVSIASKQDLSTIYNFAIAQLQSHFTSWSSQQVGSIFSLYWIKDSLILKTNSPYILNKWFTIERQYLNYLLKENHIVSDLQNAA
jgi:hypothetical protein